MSAPATNSPITKSYSTDFLASLVVFMVALPLCVAIAKACGLPAEAGIVTGIVGGLLVGFLAGSPLQVSGPAAGLIVLVQDLIQEGPLEKYALVVLLAGLMQIAAGAAKLGQWFRAVSPAVVLGMLAGIGAIILAKQLPVMVDQAASAKMSDAPIAILQAYRTAFQDSTLSGPATAGIVGAITLLFMIIWKPLVPRKLKLVPGAVVGVLVAILVTEMFNWSVHRVEIGKLFDFFQPQRMVQPSSLSLLTDPHVWVSAITLSLIASAETLLCASAVDAKHSGPRTQYNCELMAQGVGNVICGAVGALPMTGVIVRSAANVEAGAKTRLSTILHGLWLLVFVVVFPSLIQRVPLAALAAILIYTGFKLLEIPAAYNLFKTSKIEAAIFLVTAVGVVVFDLLTGVLIGMFLSAARLLWSFSHLEVVRTTDPEGRNIYLTLVGAATFLRLPLLASELDSIPPGKNLHIQLDKVDFLDHAVFELLMKFQKRHETTGGKMTVDWDQLRAQFEASRRQIITSKIA